MNRGRRQASRRPPGPGWPTCRGIRETKAGDDDTDAQSFLRAVERFGVHVDRPSSVVTHPGKRPDRGHLYQPGVGHRRGVVRNCVRQRLQYDWQIGSRPAFVDRFRRSFLRCLLRVRSGFQLIGWWRGGRGRSGLFSPLRPPVSRALSVSYPPSRRQISCAVRSAAPLRAHLQRMAVRFSTPTFAVFPQPCSSRRLVFRVLSFPQGRRLASGGVSGPLSITQINTPATAIT